MVKVADILIVYANLNAGCDQTLADETADIELTTVLLTQSECVISVQSSA